MRDRADPIPPPFGHVERPRPSREISALVAADLEAPAVVRRAAAQLGRDHAVSSGHQEWRDIAPELRAEMKEMLLTQIAARLGRARLDLKIRSHFSDPPLSLVERVERLERAAAAAERLA